MSFLVHWWPKWQQSSTLNRLLWYQVRYVFCVEPSKYRDISLPVWMLTSCKKNSGDKNKYFPISSWNSGIISIFIHYSIAVSGLLKKPHFKAGYVVIVRYKGEARRQWPVGLVEELFPSAYELVRKVHVRLIVNGKSCTYMRPINELNMRPIRELHLSNWINVYYWTFTSICSVNNDIVMNNWVRHKGMINIIVIISFSHVYFKVSLFWSLHQLIFAENWLHVFIL